MGWLFDGIATLAVKAINALLAGFGDVINALIGSWPIAMPDLPTLPGGLLTAVGWVKWSPLPVAAGLAFLLFAISVWLLWQVLAFVLRFVKVIE